MSKRILIIGACGQIGTELTLKLREINGNDAVIASDIREGNKELMNEIDKKPFRYDLFVYSIINHGYNIRRKTDKITFNN